MIEVGFIILPHSPIFVSSILALFLLFCIFISVITVRRTNKNHLGWRLVSVFGAIFSLFLLMLQPQWKSSVKQAGAVLITPGARISQLDSLSKNIGNWAFIFSLLENSNWGLNYPEIVQIPDVGYISRHFPEVNRLHVIGHGLFDYDWQELKNLQVIVHSSKTNPGIQKIRWPREVILGQTLAVSGEITGVKSNGSLIYLSGPGGIVDSTMLNTTNGSIAFNLQTKPKDTGTYLFKIFTKNNDGIAIDEEIAVAAIKPRPLKILVMQSSPKFEIRHLKSWLSEQGHSMAIRSTLSSDRYRFETINQDELQIREISSKILSEFDLALIDGNTLDTFSSTETQHLNGAIENGLGLYLVADDFILANRNQGSQFSFLSKYRFKPFKDIDIRMVNPILAGFNSDHFSDIPAEPFEIENQFGINPIVKDRMDRMLTGMAFLGEGKVGVSLVINTYQWILSGEKDRYSAYWSYLLTNLSRRENHEDVWRIPTELPLIKDRPIYFTLHTQATNPIGNVTLGGNITETFYLKHDQNEKSLWSGIFWPRTTGWHSVSTQKGKLRSFYIHDEEDWLSWQQDQKIQATHLRSGFNPGIDETKNLSESKKPRLISSVWFFLVFLICMSYLWIERKL